MDRWEIELHISPHSSGNGGDDDLAACGGEKVLIFIVHAPTARHVLDIADLLSRAIDQTNPRIWQVPIYRIQRKST